MHELSIAASIVEIVEDELAQRGLSGLRVVHLRLGLLSGVAREALEFSYQLACEGTSVEGSSLVFEGTSGRELEIVSLEVD